MFKTTPYGIEITKEGQQSLEKLGKGLIKTITPFVESIIRAQKQLRVSLGKQSKTAVMSTRALRQLEKEVKSLENTERVNFGSSKEHVTHGTDYTGGN